MREHGNKGSNALFLAEFDQKLGALPTFQSPRSEIEKHITLKYKEKKWMKKIQGDLNLKLFEAFQRKSDYSLDLNEIDFGLFGQPSFLFFVSFRIFSFKSHPKGFKVLKDSKGCDQIV